MKKFIAVLFALISLISVCQAQIPYFGGTQGKGKVYGYYAMSVYPGHNDHRSYGTLQYGIHDKFDLVLDKTSIYNADDYLGVGLRFNVCKSKYFNLGGMTVYDMNTNDQCHFAYQSTGIFINGTITGDWGYCINTWWTADKSDHSLDQWSYLSYDGLGNFHPMAGLTYSLDKTYGVDPAVGFYYTYKNYNFYLWGGNLKDKHGVHPKVTVGMEFKF